MIASSRLCVIPGCERPVAHPTTCYCSTICDGIDDEEGRKYAVDSCQYWCNGAHGPPWPSTGLCITENEQECPDSPILERMHTAVSLSEDVGAAGQQGEAEASRKDMFLRYAKKPRNAAASASAAAAAAEKLATDGEDDEDDWVVSGAPVPKQSAGSKRPPEWADLSKYKSKTQPSGQQSSILSFLSKAE